MVDEVTPHFITAFERTKIRQESGEKRDAPKGKCSTN